MAYVTSLVFVSLHTCHLISPMPGWEIKYYATYDLSFLPHYALLLLYSIGIGSPDQIFSILMGVCSVYSCVNIVSSLSPSSLLLL